MAETETPPIKDFADMAIASIATEKTEQTEAAPRQQEAAPAQTEKPAKTEERKSGIPEELLGKTEKPAKTEEATTSEVDAIAEPTFKDPKNKGGWDTLKSKAKELETKWTDAQKKLAEYEAKGKDSTALEAKMEQMQKDFTALQSKADEYEGIVKKRWIEDDPTYRKTYIDGEKAIISRAQKIVKDSGLDADQVVAGLALDGEARVKALAVITAELDTMQMARFGRAVDELDALREQAAKLRSNPEDYQRHRSEQEQQRAKQESEQFEQSMTKAWRDAQKEAGEKLIMAKKLDGVDWWNKDVDDAMTRAEQFWKSNDNPKEAALRNIKAEFYDKAVQGFTDMRAERDAVKAERDKFESELNKLYGKGPRLGGGDSTAKTDTGGDFASRVISDSQLSR